MALASTIQLGMACILFLFGVVITITGFFMMIAREYRETRQTIATQTVELTRPGIANQLGTDALNSVANLIEAIRGLIQTAVGVGAVLCVVGTSMCVLAFYMATITSR